MFIGRKPEIFNGLRAFSADGGFALRTTQLLLCANQKKKLSQASKEADGTLNRAATSNIISRLHFSFVFVDLTASLKSLPAVDPGQEIPLLHQQLSRCADCCPAVGLCGQSEPTGLNEVLVS